MMRVVSRAFAIGAWTLLLGLVAAPAGAVTPLEAAKAFVATLSTTEAQAARVGYGDRDRRRSRFTPGRRGGLALKAMDAETRAAAMGFLDAALSADGRRLVDQVMQRERILGELTGRPGYRDPELYYFALFGEPGAPRWAVRFEGHHLSLNLTYAGAALTSATPISYGSNPEKVDAPGAPPTLLGSLVEAAKADDGSVEARRRLAERVLAPAPEAFRTAYVAALLQRGAFEPARETYSGFERQGGGTLLSVETNQPNHIHIQFEDAARDFGGAQ